MKKKELFILEAISILILGLSLSAKADLGRELDLCSMACSRSCENIINEAKDLVKRAEGECGQADSAKTDCISYVLNRTGYADVARQTCENVKSGDDYRCIRLILEKTGYTDVARRTCVN